MKVSPTNNGVFSKHSSIPKYWKPIIILLFITPIVTELLTNNIPYNIFFEPKLFLTLAILVYGPILLLRELAVRWNLRLSGHILLGLAYGIYNEGLFSRTFFKLQTTNSSFVDYGNMLGINFSWAAVLVVFHAFYSFIFPLMIVYNIFPKATTTPWINKKWWLGISIACSLYISYEFLENTWPATPLHFVALVASMIVLIILSRCFRGGLAVDVKKPRLWLIVYGIVFVATTFTVADIIARSRINFVYFFTYAVINLAIAIMVLDKKYGIRNLLIFSLAAQFGFATSVIFVAVITKSETGIITGSLFALMFATALIMVIIRTKLQSNKKNQLIP